MKHAILAGALLLAGCNAPAGYYQNVYYDLIRPHGHPRSAAIHQADLDFCYAKTGANRDLPDTPAFRQCMLGRGYRFLHLRPVRSHYSPGDSSTFDSPSPEPDIAPPPPPDAPVYVPPAPTPDNPNCGGGLC